MGGDAVGFVWSLAVPPGHLGASLDEFVRGAAVLAKTRQVQLFGGDLSSTFGSVFAAMTLIAAAAFLASLRTGPLSR